MAQQMDEGASPLPNGTTPAELADDRSDRRPLAYVLDPQHGLSLWHGRPQKATPAHDWPAVLSTGQADGTARPLAVHLDEAPQLTSEAHERIREIARVGRKNIGPRELQRILSDGAPVRQYATLEELEAAAG
jgi:hypothetical protein